MERITDKYVFFWGSEFSNWHPCKFKYKDKNFSNTEQAFMWEKAMYFHDNEIADQIINTSNPRICKELGRKVRNFNAETWMIMSYSIMVSVNMAKYSQNPELKKILLSTGDKTIVEASPYDKIWGIGLYWNTDECLNESNWQGMNLLGKALMEVRSKL